MRLFTLRGPVVRMPWPLVILGWAGIRLWLVLRWLAEHGVVTVGLAAVVLLGWLSSRGAWPWLLIGAGALLAGWVVAMELRPQWYLHAVETLASWRRRRWYDSEWEAAMVGAGLTRGDDLPTLMTHRWGGQPGERDSDVLTVHMLPGQLISDWRAQQTRLAAAWGLQRLRCHIVPGVPGDVQLSGRRYREVVRGVTAQRVELHPTVQPTVQPVLQVVPDSEEPSTAVEEPGERPAGAFPRQPRGDR